MVTHARWLWIPVLTLAAIALPARAENPKISLKLVNVRPSEAVAQLSQATGIKVDLFSSNPAAIPGGEEKLNFDWTDFTFARALRQFCEKLNLRPNRSAGGYVLYPGFNAAAPAAAKKRVGLVEKSGTKIFARSISVDDRRNKNFAGDQPDSGQSYLNLQIGAEVEGDAEAISGISNVIARDDTGNFLSSDPNRNYYGGYGGSLYPDEWTGNINLGAASPRAKKILWLEGDLMAYRIVKPLKIEIPLPITTKSVRKQAGEWLVVVSQYQEAPKKAEDDDDEGLPKIGFQAQGQNLGPTMRIRVYSPNNSRLLSRSGWGVTPVLVDSAGKSYYPSRNNGSGWSDQQMMLNDNTVTYPTVPPGPCKLVWDLVERSEPVKLCSFRMTDIPLPEANNFVPRLTRPLTNGGAEERGIDTARPFYEKGGATLLNQIQIQEKPGNLGILQVGLSPKTPSGWGPVRWIDVPVDAEGIGRLADVKPGTYRVQRTYKPEGNAPLPAGGKWLNGEVVVNLVTGKEASPLPLRWGTGAAPLVRPAAGPGGVKTSLPTGGVKLPVPK